MNIIKEFDTITAIATPIGTGGIGVIRISGSKSFEIVEKFFSQKLVPGKIHHGWIFGNGDLQSRLGFLPQQHKIDKSYKKIDEVIVLPFKSPNSYTGEDVVEIQCHGGINVVRNILDLVLANGARAAERGEFTKRAFLNHKLDLSQAEAVCDLIHAKTQNFAIQSAKNLSGVLAQKTQEIKKDIFEVLSRIIAGIDFPDDVAEPEYSYLEDEFKKAIKKIDDILACAKSSNILRQGIKLAILGKPNVGKSSLFNALLSLNRAIVTDIAGTTRDVITETLDFGGIPVTLIDTAGIRNNTQIGKVEEIGIELSKQAADEADLILFLFDLSTGMNKDDEDILELIKDKNYIVIANKADLAVTPHPNPPPQGGREQAFASSHMQQMPEMNASNTPSPLEGEGWGGGTLPLSIVTKQGFEELKEKIKHFVGEKSIEDIEFTTNSRQQDCLEKAKESLNQALLAAQLKELQDLISIDVKSALLHLDEITGEVITDEILNNIFDNFCIGK